MDESWGHFAKWNKPTTERQILHDFSHMRYLKIRGSKEWSGGWQGLKGGKNGELLINVHKVSAKQDEYALEICCTSGHQ